MKELTNYKNINKNILLLTLTFLIWASIGSKYKPFPEIYDLNVKNILNYIRFLLPLFLIIIIFTFKNDYQKNFFLKFIIFSIFFSFLIGTYNLYHNNINIIPNLNNDKLLIKTGYLPNVIRDIFMAIYFVSTYLIFSRLNQSEMATYIKLNYIFLIFISFITLYFAYLEYFSNEKEYLYFTQFLITGELLGVPTIRSLGLSRNLLIIFIPLAILYIFKKEYKFKLFLVFILIFLSLNIFQLQSRLTIYSYYLFFIFIILLFFFKKNYKKIINIIILFFLIPQILHVSIPVAKKYTLASKDDNSKLLSIDNLVDFVKNIELPKSRIATLTPNNPDYSIKENKNEHFKLLSEYSSGRMDLWKTTLKIITNNSENKNTFLGFGTSADRFFLKESVSNTFLYSLISGGYIGLLFLILFYIYILFQIYIFLINKKNYSNNIIGLSAVTVIIFILLRSLVESSFLIFGSDNIILFICLFYINNKRLI